jgi:valyl-tRNA synthetase
VLKLLAPFLPHITEAVYTQGVAPDEPSIHLSPWPVAPASWDDPAARSAGEAILQVVDAARRWKAERQLSVGAKLDTLLDLQGVTQARQVHLEPAPAGAPIAIEIGEALPSG